MACEANLKISRRCFSFSLEHLPSLFFSNVPPFTKNTAGIKVQNQRSSQLSVTNSISCVHLVANVSLILNVMSHSTPLSSSSHLHAPFSLPFLFLSAALCGSSELHPRLFRPYVLPCLSLTIWPTHSSTLYTDTDISAHSHCTAIYHGEHVPLLPLAVIHFCFLFLQSKVLWLFDEQLCSRYLPSQKWVFITF